MEEGNLAILVDAKTEYTKQLVNILKTNIYTSFKSIFSEAKLKCKNENTPNNVLKEFQLMLTQVPKWNQDQINKEYNQIISSSGCDWIEELITAVFVSHTRILTSINLNRQKGKINLKIPKTTHFIHKCYVDIARLFWKNSYLEYEYFGRLFYIFFYITSLFSIIENKFNKNLSLKIIILFF